MIRLLVGLGNPGQKYQRTRHNVGFMVIDELVRHFRLRKYHERCLSHIYKVKVGGREIVLAKPQTFMNNSGRAVENLLEEFSLEPSQMLVIYDDLDLPLGSMRLRLKGGSGGHRGMESIISAVGTESFPRLRIGIGRPKSKGDVVDYVLSPFGKEEQELLSRVLDKAKRCLLRALELSLEESLEFCNRREL